jgi:hypothetical protein
MNKLVGSLALAVILLSGCTTVATKAMGLENDAYLVFIGNPDKYIFGVHVKMDGDTEFKAKVQKQNLEGTYKNVYPIPTGVHQIEVTHLGEVLLKKQIFVAAQETKILELP